MKKSIHHGILILLATYLCLTVTGCGYRFSVEGRGPTLGSSTISSNDGPSVIMAIPTLGNRTFESNLEYKYTEYLKDEFVVAGGAKVVDDIQDAEYVMKGAIQSVNLPSLTFSAKSNARKSSDRQGQGRGQRSTIRVTLYGASPHRALLNFSWVVRRIQVGGEAGLQFNRVLQDRALEQAGQFIAEDLADRFPICA